ncbi:MAG TPA: DUF1993 domain-containing protein [Caulobacteraceae bacterium]|nr:DUF1993 domain-containing protein [Caulobacteraceae bacterium]
MSLSLYDVTVPVYRQYLAALSGVLGKAAEHCASGSAQEGELTSCRLVEDMQPFTFQVALAIFHSAGAVATLRGQTYPASEGLETFAGCRAAVDAALAYLDGVRPGDLTIDLDADVVLQTPRGKMTFTARNLVFTFSYGNFFFHVTTAYDILRHRGVPIGKRDFLGAVQVKAMA